VASLCVDTQTSKRSEYEHNAKKRRPHTFVSNNSDHLITPRFKSAPALVFFKSIISVAPLSCFPVFAVNDDLLRRCFASKVTVGKR